MVFMRFWGLAEVRSFNAGLFGIDGHSKVRV